MADLGTLFFGADIDLTQLKQKINQGNQSILDALKINYDPASYNQMVNDLKHKLASETFEIKLSTNVTNLTQSLQSSKKGTVISGLDEMTDKIVKQEALVNDLRATVARLNAEYRKLGGESRRTRLEDSRAELANEKAALDTLKSTRREYTRATQQSTQAKKQAAEAARKLNSDHLRLNTTLAGGIHVSTQLGSALSSLFAVHAAKQFLNNVIEIGGQLEKQRISMGAIVGDTARANELFENIKNLAVKSPFGVVELDQYSKQLAAYGIEQSNLFNMTKRLADISAGAGQDIGRLALALGHVKSATYLTGITLRQFSMNNIPMLKMLADYYSEVEKRAVSTAEVQKRISKRQVSYEDVLEQIKRMTDEGGRFYNMQEKVSESLQAKFKNLRDSFDIMYGEIAESQIGDWLKAFASGATEISREWKRVITVIGEVALLFGTYKAAIVAANWATNNLNANTIAVALSNGKLSVSMIDRYVKTGQITKAQLLQAVATKKVTAAEAELAAATYNVTRAQLDQIAVSGRYNGMLAQTSLATSRFTVSQLRLMAALRSGNLSWLTQGLTGVRLGFSLAGTAAKAAGSAIKSFVAPLAGFAVFSSILDIFFEKSRKAEEQERRLAEMAETANEAYKNMSQARDKFKAGASEGMQDSELETNITEMIEHLQNYSKTAKDTFNNAFAVDKEGKAVHSLKEQYEILAKAIDDTTESYAKFNEVRPMVEHSIAAGKGDKGMLDYAFGWLDSVGEFFGMSSKSNRTHTLDLKESVEYYAECLNEASKAEQVFLRNRLDIVSVLENMGIADAAKMTNEQILEKITEWMYAFPEKYKEFKSNLQGESEDAFSVVIDKWNELGVASIAATDRMKRSGEDFYKSAKVFWGEDMQRWPAGWQNTVILAMNEAIKGVKGFENMTEEAQNDIRNIWLAPFKITIDSEEAQKRVNNLLVELQNLVGTDWTVQIGIKGISSIEDVEAASKTYKKAVGDVESTTKRLTQLEKQGKKNTEAYRQTLKDQADAIALRDKSMQTLYAYGADLPKTDNKPKGGSKADKQLEEWKKQISLLDKYRQELDKLSKYMNRKDAEIKLQAEGNFSSLFGIFSDPNDYVGSLNEMIRKLGTSGARGDYANELFAKIGDEGLRRFTEDADNATSELQRMLDVMQENYNTYKQWIDLTGDRTLAAKVAGVSENSSYYDYLEKEYERLGGAAEMSAKKFFGLLESEAKEYGEKSGLFVLWKEWQENSKKITADDLKMYEEAIKNAKSYEDKIADINRGLKEEIEAIKKLAKSPEEQDVLISNATKNANKKIADETWKNFKEENDWGRIFADIEKMSTQTLKTMIDKLHEVAPTINESVEATKALYEAIEKMQNVLDKRNPFAAIIDSLSRRAALKDLLKNLEGSSDNDEVYIPKADAKKMGISSGTQKIGNVRKQAGDKLTESEKAFVDAMENAGKTFQSLQDILDPVITLFETLGETDITDFLKIGSDMFNSAASVASGFSTISNLFTDKDGNKTALGNALGNAGPYGAAAAAALSMVSGIFALHDKALQKEIEASEARKKEMENLTKNLENVLERTLGGIYETTVGSDAIERLKKEIINEYKGINSFVAKVMGVSNTADYKEYLKKDTIEAVKNAEKTKKYYDAAYASLLAQRDEIQHQMESEEEKKNSDADKIADFRQQLIEAEDEIKYFAQDMAKSLWDIDVKSWAQSLTETIVDAWKNGENAVDSYKNKVKEMMLDLTTSILSQNIMEKLLKKVGLDNLIEKLMVDTKGELDVDAIASIADKLNEVGETSAELIVAILDKMEQQGYISKDESTSSSIGSSIKGITENTADLLAAYLNAVRADVSVIRITDAQYYPQFLSVITQVSVLAQTQVTLQQQIAQNTQRNAIAADNIYDIMKRIENGVTKIKMA